jgi:hypothetical protein
VIRSTGTQGNPPQKCNAQVWVAIGDALRNHPLESKLNREPKGNGSLVVMCVVDVAQRAKAVTRVDCCGRPTSFAAAQIGSIGGSSF